MPRTNGETLLWHQDGLLNGRISEEKFKAEAIKFFGLTQEESCKSKQYFKKDIQEFINKHVNLQKSTYFERILGRKWRNWQTSRNSARGLQDGSAGGKTEKVGFFKIWPRRDEILKKIPRLADSRLQSFLKDRAKY